MFQISQFRFFLGVYQIIRICTHTILVSKSSFNKELVENDLVRILLVALGCLLGGGGVLDLDMAEEGCKE
jgi:hypothetical protein